MAYREVTMIEIKEVLRQWLAGVGKKCIAARVGVDPKTVRRYTRAGEACGLSSGQGEGALTDEVVNAILATLCGSPVKQHGEAWHQCQEQRSFIEEKLSSRVRLSKVRRLLLRQGIDIPYSTLHRLAAVELGFGRKTVTLPVVDGEPGEELQVDTGWMTLLEPLFTPAFLEYAQARGFHIDPARVRTPTDKSRVERGVRDVRDDCFGGERMFDLEQTRMHARRWCEHEYGMRRHSTTYRLPREHFEAVEKAALVPAPIAAFDVPLWSDPKVARDHFAQVARALYSLPTRLIGKKLRARADSQLVRFYDAGVLVKTHLRQPPR